jgi:hypothetical protein
LIALIFFFFFANKVPSGFVSWESVLGGDIRGLKRMKKEYVKNCFKKENQKRVIGLGFQCVVPRSASHHLGTCQKCKTSVPTQTWPRNSENGMEVSVFLTKFTCDFVVRLRLSNFFL